MRSVDHCVSATMAISKGLRSLRFHSGQSGPCLPSSEGSFGIRLDLDACTVVGKRWPAVIRRDHLAAAKLVCVFLFPLAAQHRQLPRGKVEFLTPSNA